MCRDCKENKEREVYIWRALDPVPVCKACCEQYWKENQRECKCVVLYISIKIVTYLEFSCGGTVKEISNYLRLNKPHCQYCTAQDSDMSTEDEYFQSKESICSKCGICETVSFQRMFFSLIC